MAQLNNGETKDLMEAEITYKLKLQGQFNIVMLVGYLIALGSYSTWIILSGKKVLLVLVIFSLLNVGIAFWNFSLLKTGRLPLAAWASLVGSSCMVTAIVLVLGYRPYLVISSLSLSIFSALLLPYIQALFYGLTWYIFHLLFFLNQEVGRWYVPPLPNASLQPVSDLTLLTVSFPIAVLLTILPARYIIKLLTSHNRNLQQLLAEKNRQAEQIMFQAHLLDNLPHGALVTDAAGYIIYWNNQAEQMFGMSRAHVLGKRPDQLTSQYDTSKMHEFLNQLILSGHYEEQIVGYRADGTSFPLYTINSVVKDQSGVLRGTISILMDISEAKRVENALAAEKEKLYVTLHSIGDGVIVTDTNAIITRFNPAAEKMTGWQTEEAVGKHLHEIFKLVNHDNMQDVPNPVYEALERNAAVGLGKHTALVAKDGKFLFISNTAAPVRDHAGNVQGVVLTFRDVTNRQRREAEQQKSQKLESLGLLAGGIAHDFNNILTGIVGNLSLVRTLVGNTAEAVELFDEIERASERAKDLTQRLLTFAQGGSPIRQSLDLAKTLLEITNFTLRNSQVFAHLVLPPYLWTVEVDPVQINQVFQNLIVNADEAMPKGGQLTIRAENISASELDAALPLNPANYVQITVQDNGTGIPEALLPRVFDLYFTTKDRGSGLGLATTYSIVRRHGGYISVSSQVGTGTTFTVYLPATYQEQAKSAPKPVQSVAAPVVPLAERPRILLMDDDATIRNLGVRVLTRAGYSVEPTNDGAQAVSAYEQAYTNGTPYALVIMDLTVPGGMGGQEALQEIHRINPHVRSLVWTGYSDKLAQSENVPAFNAFLRKPFLVQDLLEKVNQALYSSN
jgi:PAS domain S-box-containing protein